MLLVQADHMFMDSHKILVMSDSGTGLLGIASIDSNPDRTISDIKQFFRQLGVDETSSMTVEVLVDSEPALARSHFSKNRIVIAHQSGSASGT